MTIPITNNPLTWPSGSKTWNVCRAIALAEGANISGSVPDKLNNPGDISDGSHLYGSETHSGSSVTKFPNKLCGWVWLYLKIQRIARGKSAVYKPDMTWNAIAMRYAGDSMAWVNNVTKNLGVKPTDIFGDYFK